MSLPKNVDELYRLSPMQHLMLLHAIAEDGHGVLVNQVSFEIRGALDVEAFRWAWETLVARHAALRTVFLWDGLPHPVQVVRSSVSFEVPLVDHSTLTAAERADALAALRAADARAPMALGKAPLMRCVLIRHGDTQHHFLWSIHHLVVDRWSHAVLFDELRALYAARCAGTSIELTAAPRFHEYIRWLTQQDHADAERFWRAELADFHAPTPLGTGQPRAVGDGRTTTRHTVAADVTAAVRRSASRWRVTPGAVLQAAVALLLAARSGRDDVVYGLTVSGRPPALPDVANTVGSFVNNVPARVRLSRAQTIEALVRDVHQREGRRSPFVHVSPAELHGWSALAPGRALFDTLLLLNLTNDEQHEWPGLTIATESATLDAGYPFVLAIGVDGNSYSLHLVHDTSFIDAPTLLASLEATLAQLTAVGDTNHDPRDDARDDAGDMPRMVGDLLPALPMVVASTESETEQATGAAAHARAARGGVSHAGASTEHALSDQLLDAWRDVLGFDDLGLDDDFFAVGGTSLQAAQLFARIERIVGKALPLSTLFSAGSVRSLLAELDRPVERSGALVRVRSAGTLPPLYVVPGIGGNVVSLHGLARHLGPEQPFSAFASPGLDGREAPLTTIEAIAARYSEELRQIESGPIHLVGICWGAAVAFEMARQLQAAGRAPATLSLMDPAVLLRESSTRAPLGDVGFLRDRIELYWDEFRAGSWRERSRLVASKARRAAKVLTGTGEIAGSQSDRNLFRVREANTIAVTRYLPEPYEGHARLFITADRDVGDGADPRLEWLTLISPIPSVVQIGGSDSGDAISPAHVAGFARALQSWLQSWLKS